MVLTLNDEGLIIKKENKKRQAGKNFIERARFLLFWVSLTQFVMYEKSVHSYYFDEKEKEKRMYMKCSKCGVYKEATTDNYTANQVSRADAGGIEKWFGVDASIKIHSWNNGNSRGCNECFAAKSLIRNNDTVGNGYIINIMVPYTELHVHLTDEEKEKIMADYKANNNGKTLKCVPKTDRGLGWFQDNMNVACWASGFKTTIVKKSHPFMLSPNDTVLQEAGKYDQRKGHKKENVVGVRAFANIRQTTTKIPNLQNAFVALYEMIVADYYKSPEQLKADEDAALLTLTYSSLNDMEQNSKKADAKKGREWDMTTRAVVKKLTELRMRCNTTGVIMSVESGPFRVHGDRINNAIGHLIETNVEFKCMLFVNQCRLTRKQFIHGFLEQELVFLPEGLRAKLKAEYDANPENIEDCDETHEGDDDNNEEDCEDEEEDKKRKRGF